MHSSFRALALAISAFAIAVASTGAEVQAGPVKPNGASHPVHAGGGATFGAA